MVWVAWWIMLKGPLLQRQANQARKLQEYQSCIKTSFIFVIFVDIFQFITAPILVIRISMIQLLFCSYLYITLSMPSYQYCSNLNLFFASQKKISVEHGAPHLYHFKTKIYKVLKWYPPPRANVQFTTILLLHSGSIFGCPLVGGVPR